MLWFIVRQLLKHVLLEGTTDKRTVKALLLEKAEETGNEFMLENYSRWV